MLAAYMYEERICETVVHALTVRIEKCTTTNVAQHVKPLERPPNTAPPSAAET